MNLLLDTHTFLWWLDDDPRLPALAREAIQDPTRLVWVSAASLWEISIKTHLGKLEVDGDLVAEIAANGFRELAASATHAWTAGALPRHHEDPFDRMLLAQAKLEKLTLVSRDSIFAAYDVPLLWS